MLRAVVLGRLTSWTHLPMGRRCLLTSGLRQRVQSWQAPWSPGWSFSMGSDAMLGFSAKIAVSLRSCSGSLAPQFCGLGALTTLTLEILTRVCRRSQSLSFKQCPVDRIELIRRSHCVRRVFLKQGTRVLTADSATNLQRARCAGTELKPSAQRLRANTTPTTKVFSSVPERGVES